MSEPGAIAQTGYRPRPDLSFAEVGDRFVFLDVAADRYFMLTPPAETALREIIAGAPGSSDIAQPLLTSGLLVPDVQIVPIAPCKPPPNPRRSLLDDAETEAAFLATVRAATAVQTSRLRLRWRSLRDNLKLPSAADHAGMERSDVGLRRLAATYARAARWISTQDRCLAQSLAVARAARRAGIAVDLVLGVTLGPFRAHCWVQSGSIIVNDRVDLVARFIPILVR